MNKAREVLQRISAHKRSNDFILEEIKKASKGSYLHGLLLGMNMGFELAEFYIKNYFGDENGDKSDKGKRES